MTTKNVYYHARPVLFVDENGRTIYGSCKRVEGPPNDCKHEFVHHSCSPSPEYICHTCEQIKPVKHLANYRAGAEAGV